MVNSAVHKRKSCHTIIFLEQPSCTWDLRFHLVVLQCYTEGTIENLTKKMGVSVRILFLASLEAEIHLGSMNSRPVANVHERALVMRVNRFCRQSVYFLYNKFCKSWAADIFKYSTFFATRAASSSKQKQQLETHIAPRYTCKYTP